MLLARRIEAVARLGAFVGKEAEILRGADRGLGHEAMRLAGVDAFQYGDIVGAILDRVGDAVQQLLAHGSGHRAPGFEGFTRNRGGAVDVLGSAAGNVCQHRAVDRRFRFKALTRDRRHDLAVDHVTDAFCLQFCQQGGGAVEVGLEKV